MERSASWASDEASRRGPADGLSLRVGDWNSGTLFTAASRLPAMWVWFLRKNPAAIAVDWDTSANRAARFCAICCRSGAGHGAQSTAVAQQVLSLAMLRGRKIAKVAMARKLAVHLYWKWRQGWDYGQFEKFGSHAGEPGNRHGRE
jgi:hypothetical protein